jgi:indole-3-glycerol phosphate synthase
MTSNFVETGTYLDRILVRTAADLAVRKEQRPLDTLYQDVEQRGPARSLAAALRRDTIAVISEVKRASPSRGRFNVEIDPEALAAEYLAGGAAAISVLTDEPFFQGSLDDMQAVARAAVNHAPVLRKDFVIDHYQLVEARAFGADAALLIVAALTQDQLISLSTAASELGLSTLVEIHNEEELERAVAAGADVIGINNRDLHSFHVDLAVSERLAPRCPSTSLVVSESGIFTRDDVERVAQAGASAILVGEALITAADRTERLRELTTVPRT